MACAHFDERVATKIIKQYANNPASDNQFVTKHSFIKVFIFDTTTL